MTLQASLIYRSLIPQFNPLSFSVNPQVLTQNSIPTPIFESPLSFNSRFALLVSCTLHPENDTHSANITEDPETYDLTKAADVSIEQEAKKTLPILVFFMGVLKNGIERLSWFSWWRQEKRLERLIEEADATPMDAAKQGLLLAELNKLRLLSFSSFAYISYF